jgi:predicted nucleotide-binding protein
VIIPTGGKRQPGLGRQKEVPHRAEGIQLRRDPELILNLLLKLEEYPSRPGEVFVFGGALSSSETERRTFITLAKGEGFDLENGSEVVTSDKTYWTGSPLAPAPHSLTPAASPLSSAQQAQVSSRKVFLVHGRDENAKNEVALFLRKIGLDDIILHQRPSRGRHLLTKFQEEAEGASFAVVLMTPDDVGGIVGGPHQKRARQNVVLELGFFIGKLGTPRVAALIGPGVEKPSDFDGICWIEFGPGANWKNELARELREADVPFDAHEVFNA